MLNLDSQNRVLGFFGLGFECFGEHLEDQMTLKSRGPIPIYYESLYGI